MQNPEYTIHSTFIFWDFCDGIDLISPETFYKLIFKLILEIDGGGIHSKIAPKAPSHYLSLCWRRYV